MRFNLERNLDATVIGLNAAVCGERKSLRIKVGKGGTSDSIYNPIIGENGKEVEIQGVTIDELYNEYFNGEPIDLCKMDIEGAEHEFSHARTTTP
jgi:FkbM family methyltransferase